ncbi:MAG: restriction endonuclease subunit S [Nanoarchaeota archaeon]
MKQQNNQLAIEWKEVALGEICRIVSGSTPSTTNLEYWDGKINWVTPAELIDGNNWYYYETQRKISVKGLKSCSAELFPIGTVMLTSRAPIGKVAISGTEMCSNQGFKNLICDKNKVNPEYIYYWLRSKKEYLNSLGHGATFKEISKKIVSKINIPLPFHKGHPDLETQKSIVSVLEKAEKLKTDGKRTIELFDEYLKSVFNEMFVGKRFTLTKLGDLCSEITDGSHRTPKLLNEGYSFLTVANLGDSDFDYTAVKRISKAEYLDLVKNGCRPEKGDVLFSKDGTVGKVMRINKTEEIVVLSSIAILKPDTKLLDSIYLEYSLKSDDVLSQAIKKKSGSAIRRIILRQLKKVNIYAPPLNIQQKFASIVEHVEKLKEIQKRENERLNQIFDSLMQKAFRGDLIK